MPELAVTQLTLPMEPPAGNALEADYRAWRDTNPEVFALFRRFAEDLAAQGRRFGIALLAERVRWEIRTTWAPDQQGFKVNNNWRAFIARDLCHEMPALSELIEMRRSVADQNA